jgi:uncharacterized protein (TIGR02466 family)
MNLFTNYLLEDSNEDLADYLYLISKDILDKTPLNEKYLNGKTTYYTHHFKDFGQEKLVPLFNFIFKNAVKYLETLKVDTKKYNVHLNDLWFSEMYMYGSHGVHAHYNNDLSGNFYIHCEEKSSSIKFLKTDYLYGMMENVDFTEHNCFNSTSWKIPAEKGKLLMWQSNLLHEVETNLSNSRIAVSFNLKVIKNDK